MLFLIFFDIKLLFLLKGFIIYLFIFQVYDFVRLNELYYVGSHGMDIMAPLKCSKNASSSFHEKAIDENVGAFLTFFFLFNFAYLQVYFYKTL